MDFNVHPRDNFFEYSNGNWMKNNQIPAGYPSWNSFMALRVKSQEDLKEILEELEERLKKVGRYYFCIDIILRRFDVFIIIFYF